MIDLERHYGQLKTRELVQIIEGKDGYQKKVVVYCLFRIAQKNLALSILKEHATVIHEERFFNYFTEGNHLNNTPIEMTSHYLTQKEMKACFANGKARYIQYREDGTRGLPYG